ncbi:penicillin-binding protein 1C [Ideonella sp. A 288]|uniref:penicillin-binding protein 1C n=1 Tax=Ideonella sp. A 288 TaxID=1962181 RepID=UPI001F468DE9|nr:penicillin-binding protein 1C [Ideonella sp. A 288]
MTRPLLVVALTAMLAAAAGTCSAAVPGFVEVQQAHRPSDTWFVDRHGEPLQALRTDLQARRGAWLPLAQFSPALRELAVQGEDRRFWTHAGVDWPAAARSAWANAQGRGAVQGASTITMQLAALLDPALDRPSGGRSLGQKLSQVAAARDIEAGWRKPQILEAYLNLVPLRGELVGVPAAAQALFGKHPSGLDRAESALLVALLRAPSAPAARVTDRACALLAAPPRCERVAALAERVLAGRSHAVQSPTRIAEPRSGEALAPHFARWLSSAPPGVSGGPTIRTTLDARLQRLARQLLREQLAELQGREVEDGAVLVLDNASGEVLAWVGSSGPGLSEAHEVDAVLARRQPGSTIKPFVYGLAFEQGLLTPASLLGDTPADLDGGSGAFMPRNYDHRYRGWVSARTALASSLNVPTARVADLLGADALFDRLQGFGMALSGTGGHHGLALALGSADVTLLHLANAYRSLANGGLWTPVTGRPRGTATAPAPRRVLDTRAAFHVADILADAGARAATFGLDSALVTRGFAAVKTGTSKDMRDNWCIGFTDRYTVGVWVGNAGGAPMRQVSGTQGAAPVWRALVSHLHERQVSRAPRPPAGLVAQALRFEPALEPPRSEWLLAAAPATVPLRVQAGEQVVLQRPAGIAHPRDGTVFALDPDMPSPVQRIRFTGEAGQWWLDGRLLGHGPSLAWAPWPGRHRLALKSADGRVVDQVAFEVRGATVRGSPARGEPARP